MPKKSEEENSKLWAVDPAMYVPKVDEASFFERRIAPFLRQIGKFALITLALTYPVYLVVIGIVFGGLVFWSFMVGSFAVMGLIISRLGFAPRFSNFGRGYAPFIGLVGGFLAALGFYAGLLYLRTWLVLPVIAFVGFGLYLLWRRLRS